MVNTYYNLVTDFYEWGWGQSFHFAVRSQMETFPQSIARHQHWLAAQMGIKKGMNVLDVGCTLTLKPMLLADVLKWH